MKRAALWCLLLSTLAACSKGPPDATMSASAEPAPSASASASAAPPALVLRPPEGAASREDREKAALALLSGKAHAADLPLVDADEGEAFDPVMRKAQQSARGGDIRIREITATGLSDKAVQRAVEHEMRRIRRCYGAGLTQNPNLQGRVSARAIVKAAGKPEHVDNGGSDMPDSSVVRCVLSVFERLDFPAPEGPEGKLLVHIMFAPR